MMFEEENPAQPGKFNEAWAQFKSERYWGIKKIKIKTFLLMLGRPAPVFDIKPIAGAMECISETIDP